MTPSIQRSDPPYMQVVKHIRDQIESGELEAGAKISSARQVSKDWNISLATATKALTTLRSEGLVRGVSGVGTIVNTREMALGSKNRASSSRAGQIYPSNEYAKIQASDIVNAPEQVADALGLETGAPVLRRQRVTFRDDEPVSASISWFDGALVKLAPRLLEAERIRQGTPGYIEETTGRTMTYGRDQNTADAATEQDAEDLNASVGSPVLRGRNWIYDSDGGVIEYGEYVSTAGRWRSYDYEIA